MSYYIDDNITIAINKEAFLTMLYSLIYKVISTTSGEKKVIVKVSRKEDGDRFAIPLHPLKGCCFQQHP
ncbi:MAG: hypothetical protein E7123_04190 [Bacteroidales bacterium]|nr:hypothetical protein [Bacteroidales bacterium]